MPRAQSALAMTLLFTRGEVQGRARGDAHIATRGRCRMCPRLDSQHKHRVRRGGRRRGDTKARHEFCTDRFAGQEGTDTISTSAAERIPKPWFWRRSFLPFFRRRKKGSRRRHDAGYYGLPRAQSALAMTYQNTKIPVTPSRRTGPRYCCR